MKKHFLYISYMAALFSLSIILSSCEKLLPEKLSFDLEKTITFTVDPAPAIGTVTLSDLKVNIDLDSALVANNVDNYTISDIKPSNISLETETANTNLNAFDSLTIFIAANGLPEKKIAYKYDIANDIQRLPLEIENVNVAEYLREKPTNFKIQATLGDSIQKRMKMNLDVIFKVEVKKK